MTAGPGPEAVDRPDTAGRPPPRGSARGGATAALLAFGALLSVYAALESVTGHRPPYVPGSVVELDGGSGGVVTRYQGIDVSWPLVFSIPALLLVLGLYLRWRESSAAVAEVGGAGRAFALGALLTAVVVDTAVSRSTSLLVCGGAVLASVLGRRFHRWQRAMQPDRNRVVAFSLAAAVLLLTAIALVLVVVLVGLSFVYHLGVLASTVLLAFAVWQRDRSMALWATLATSTLLAQAFYEYLARHSRTITGASGPGHPGVLGWAPVLLAAVILLVGGVVVALQRERPAR